MQEMAAHQLTLPGVDASDARTFIAAAVSVSPLRHPSQRELDAAYLRTVRRYSRRQTAQAMGVSIKTVDTYWRNLAAKADCAESELRDRLVQAYGWQLGYGVAHQEQAAS